jgi:chemotaxis protein methyltransferase CheR
MSLTHHPRDFEFTDHDFQRIRKLIHDHAGIALSDAKRDLVYSRLTRRLRNHEIETFAEYITLLEKQNGEWELFVNSLTTNLTSFFREPHHFPILSEHIASIRQRQSIQLWCSAASTGEEAYSMAITMAELFNSFSPPVRILATDIDTQVLLKAKAGIYTLDKIDKLTDATRRRFFIDNSDGTVTVRPELRNLITFQQQNLVSSNWSFRGPFDAIFCRNVMIYFDKTTQTEILRRFIPVMRRDGLLFAGHSESFHHANDLFDIKGRTVYGIAQAAQRLAQS